MVPILLLLIIVPSPASDRREVVSAQHAFDTAAPPVSMDQLAAEVRALRGEVTMLRHLAAAAWVKSTLVVKPTRDMVHLPRVWIFIGSIVATILILVVGLWPLVRKDR